MKTYYDRRAPWHDKYMGYVGNGPMEELLIPIIRSIEPYITDRTVLEIACGTGNWTQVLAKRARTVLALDSSSSSLKIASKKLQRYVNVILSNTDAYTLEGVDGTLETAFAADWWSHIPNARISAFLHSLHRKLVAGSRVTFVDMSYRDDFNNDPTHFDSDGKRR